MMKVPDRWLDYTSIGNVVPDSSFIAFKVPLHKHICERLPSPERHTITDVVESVPRLGLVINLTNTQNDSKYYQPHEWQRYGVAYKWIRTEGHKTPSQSLLIEFCRTVKNFLVSNPEKLVGVHCTHGLNRTGYFVCSFLVLCCNVSPSDALRNFGVARGHQIERPNYIQAVMLLNSNDKLKRLISSRGSTSRSNSIGPPGVDIDEDKRNFSTDTRSRNRRDNNSIPDFYEASNSRRFDSRPIERSRFDSRPTTRFDPRGPVRPRNYNTNEPHRNFSNARTWSRFSDQPRFAGPSNNSRENYSNRSWRRDDATQGSNDRDNNNRYQPRGNRYEH